MTHSPRGSAPIVELTPGDHIQPIVEAHPPGTVYRFAPGEFNEQTILPKDDDQYCGDGMGRSTLHGRDTTPHAFIYDDAIRHPQRVLIRDLTCTHYTGGASRGMIYGQNGTDWTLRRVELSYSGWRGADAGAGFLFDRCDVHHNGVAGLNGYRATDLQIRNCTIAFNNTRRWNPDTADGEGGGVKLGETVGAIIAGNCVHDNAGVGLWLDCDCHEVLMEQNDVARNSHRGYHVEISDRVLFRGGMCYDNGRQRPLPGGCGLFVSSSSRVQVYGVEFDGQAVPLVAITQDRGSGPYGVRETRDLHCHHNRTPLGAPVWPVWWPA
jgi:hypothetical protein